MAKKTTETQENEENVVIEDERYYVLNVAGDFNITVNDGGKVNILYGKPVPPPPPPHQ